jgi:1-acyl-sn-glycerol-3-phosphate acyltransferase
LQLHLHRVAAYHVWDFEFWNALVLWPMLNYVQHLFPGGCVGGLLAFDGAVLAMDPARRLTRPCVRGLERLPKQGPRLFVGNHTLGGVFDVPWLVEALYRERGIVVHALADHAHFDVPGWRSLLGCFGVVDGTRANCATLFEQGSDVLVFPGGAREVAKRKGEQYKLIWGRRKGFARMALAHGVQIVPFAAVGMEDALDVVLDANDLLSSPLGGWIRRLGIREDMLVPVVRGIGPTPIPRPERLYFEVLDPIDPAVIGGDDPDARAWALREEVRRSIERGLASLKEFQANDPERTLRGRLGRRFTPRGLSTPG